MNELREQVYNLEASIAKNRKDIREFSTMNWIMEKQKKIDESNGALTWKDVALEERGIIQHNKQIDVDIQTRLVTLVKTLVNDAMKRKVF